MSGEKKSSRSPYLLISAIVFIALGMYCRIKEKSAENATETSAKYPFGKH